MNERRDVGSRMALLGQAVSDLAQPRPGARAPGCFGEGGKDKNCSPVHSYPEVPEYATCGTWLGKISLHQRKRVSHI